MKKPYYIKHRHELKPREIVRLTDREKESCEDEVLGQDLILVRTTEPALRLFSIMGNPLECEIQSHDDAVD